MEILKSLEIYPIILLTDFLRYFIVAGAAYLFFWVLFKGRLRHRIIQRKTPKFKKMWFEFCYSMSTVLIFSLVGLGIVQFERAGYTRIYEDIKDYGWIWFCASIVLMLLLHDAYFYWTHRLLHHPKIFRRVHLVHHRSTNPSPWAAYSFHPIEALIEAGIFPLVVFIIPAHTLALALFLLYMITRNVTNHLGIEFLPAWFLHNKWINWHTTATHHDLHHKNFNSNYGLYFTWWDKWFGTEDKNYVEIFEEVASREKEPSKTEESLFKTSKSTVLLLLIAGNLLAQSPVGLWQSFHEKSGLPLSLIRIEESPKGVEGKVEKIFLQPWEGKDPICAKCPGMRKDQKIIGMTFLWGFDPNGKNGFILDPASGEIYKSKMWLTDENVLKVRGYAGPMNLFYRTQNWIRQKAKSDQNPFIGIWKTIDDFAGRPKSLVEIFEKEGELHAKILQIYLLPWEGENPICPHCPDEKQNAEIIGMTILWNFIKNGDQWSEGKIMDPGNGKTYKGAIWLENAKTLKVRGYLGPFFRTQRWRRVE